MTCLMKLHQFQTTQPRITGWYCIRNWEGWRRNLSWPSMKDIMYRECHSLRPPLWSSGLSSWLRNGDVLCFLWGTNWIYIYYVEESRLPLWSSGQSSWLRNGDVLCFLWGTNWIYACYIDESRPPLLSGLLATERRCIMFPVRYGQTYRVELSFK
jgi:hypothetical protein